MAVEDVKAADFSQLRPRKRVQWQVDDVAVVGAGGLGAPIVLYLAKMGMTNISVWDDDTIEEHNIPNTLLPMQIATNVSLGFLSTAGVLKTAALYAMVEDMTGTSIKKYGQRWPAEGYTAPEILISGVDSMASRQAIYDDLKASRPDREYSFYVDARMGGETGDVFVVMDYREDYMAMYEQHLFSDDEVDDEPCTARAIIYNTACVGSVVCSLVKKYLLGYEEMPWRVLVDTRNLRLWPQFLKSGSSV